MEPRGQDTGSKNEETGGTDQYVHIQETKPSCMCCCVKKLEVYVCSMFKDVCVGVGWRHCYMTGGLWHMYGDHSQMEGSKAVCAAGGTCAVEPEGNVCIAFRSYVRCA